MNNQETIDKVNLAISLVDTTGNCKIDKMVLQDILELYKIEKRKNKIKNEYLKLLVDIGYDYDGLSKPKDLKGLIDELVGIAVKAIQNDDKTAIYNDGIKGMTPKNILLENVKEK